jgi:hypothetical protein
MSALVAQINPSLVQFAAPTAPVPFQQPSAAPSSVQAFQAAMDAPLDLARVEELFGTLATDRTKPASVADPLLRLPSHLDYLTGTIKTLETIFPTVPGQLPSPTDLLGAQMLISAAQLEWQFIAKATGTAVQGVQSLVNSQV